MAGRVCPAICFSRLVFPALFYLTRFQGHFSMEDITMDIGLVIPAAADTDHFQSTNCARRRSVLTAPFSI
jgi:hypothetical protein